MKAIFLDIDGVLNTYSTKEISPNGFTGIDKRLVEKLSKIIYNTDAKVVLSSSWRELTKPEDEKDYIYMENCLKDFNITIYDKTPKDNLRDRGKEIREYLDNHKEIEKFIILDDCFEEYFKRAKLTPYFLQCNPIKGITDNIVRRSIKYLNSDKKTLY